MSVHFNREILFFFGIFASALAGSLHCVAMCGGLIVASAPTPFAQMRYHLGRLLGYITLGALGGLIGKNVLSDFQNEVFSYVFASFLGVFFIFMGLRVIRGKSFHVELPFFKTLYNKGPFLAGSASALLPCGWFHGFLLVAIVAASPIRGALILFFFWLGTLPALISAGTIFEKILTPLQRKRPLLTGSLLIFLGLGTLYMKLLPNFGSKELINVLHQCIRPLYNGDEQHNPK